ncbi:hypothetical protein SK128_013513 [Halocaridina rubra]|uniref:Uncharacterized protein n=1 Tax=Halocaridina rubra TaxID=373956 RepID=A0AAN8WRZ9_HALRR
MRLTVCLVLTILSVTLAHRGGRGEWHDRGGGRGHRDKYQGGFSRSPEWECHKLMKPKEWIDIRSIVSNCANETGVSFQSVVQEDGKGRIMIEADEGEGIWTTSPTLRRIASAKVSWEHLDCLTMLVTSKRLKQLLSTQTLKT